MQSLHMSIENVKVRVGAAVVVGVEAGDRVVCRRRRWRLLARRLVHPRESGHGLLRCLQQLVQHLSQCPLNGSEKRQLAEGSKAAEKLKEKLTYGQVEEDVIVQCNRLVSAVLQRDYATASAVQVALVNSHWAAHKDWLKGVKFLCQLAQKKMQ